MNGTVYCLYSKLETTLYNSWRKRTYLYEACCYLLSYQLWRGKKNFERHLPGEGEPLRYQIYWCTHTQISFKIPHKQLLTFLQESTLKQGFCAASHQIWPPKFCHIFLKHPFFLKINFFRPINVKGVLHVHCKKDPFFTHFFFVHASVTNISEW